MSQDLNTIAAAARSGLARQTLAKLRCIGGGPPFRKVGAKVFYPKAELEKWILAHPLQTITTNGVGTAE